VTKDIQVYHHLGLGDHIICNGLIRYLCRNYEKVYCFVKEHNLNNVSFMFRDEPRIELIAVKDKSEVPSKIIKDSDVIRVGFENVDMSHDNFDKTFYTQLGYDFSLRWDNFYVEREYEKEHDLFVKLNPHNVPYIVIHDDAYRGFMIDPSKVREDMKIIKSSDCFISGKMKAEFREYTIFHWILVLERAEEIHCMDSSFKCLVESLPKCSSPRLFYHVYVRGTGRKAVSSTRKNWVIVKKGSLSVKGRSLVIIKSLSPRPIETLFLS